MKDPEEFKYYVHKQLMDKLLKVQIGRIMKNISTFHLEDKIKLFKILEKVESPNVNDINVDFEIQL